VVSNINFIGDVVIEKKVVLLNALRKKIKEKKSSTGSWLQLADASVAEIMANSGYDWLAIDLEHGIINAESLVNLCRAIELHGTLPLVRLSGGSRAECKQALEAGAAGVILPMVKSCQDVESVLDNCRWPPLGTRGVGFSRSNMFGKYFNESKYIAANPFFVPMIENVEAVDDLDNICSTDGVDALFVGPYDLSASLGCLGDFESDIFKNVMEQILKKGIEYNVPVGMHVVDPNPTKLQNLVNEGFRFNAFSIDSVFLLEASRRPIIVEN